ncbi:thiol reductant ABC exporter subunit CydC [Vagococcus xieshaowenii]|uniref:Thiol reductant ABC exporter subunit CydC n=1 Tax=Vagococcus xieshaowenii TaxID=2562451 RepID=A0AAJ5EEA4_9ENTE|nr:thiol reductant ABC exporter subunit CydC [Vagococcus xieshaowenii]QCA29384.1 thiol reductant ABC exporter subunit CydC [Vagococcus xieshaowenii]TFZ39325.1 thiol reductant ABC exporter subunit CydC [Vagococcus xieshaowenii]
MSKNTPKRLLLSKEDTWIRPYFKKYKKLLALVLFLGLLTFFSASALMFTSGFLISRSAAIGVFNATLPAKPENIMKVYVASVLTRLFGISRPTFRYAERLGSHNWVLKMTSDIRLRLYNALETRAAKSKQSYQTGDIMGILAEDIEHIQNLYLRTIFPTLIGLAMYVLVIIALGWFSIPFALFAALMFGVITILIPLVSVAVNQARIYRRKAKRHELYTELTDSVLGVGDWQYSGRQAEFLEHYNQSEASVREEEAALNKHTRLRNLLIQLVYGVLIIGLFIWAGTYFAPDKLNWVGAFVLAAFPLMDAFNPIANGVTEMPLYEDSAQRLHQLPNPDEEALKETHLLDKLPEQGDLSFQDVTFHYPDSKKLVANAFDLEVPSGEVLAVLGKSGTGKTTLSKLLRGDLLTTSGEILIDGIPVTQMGDDMSKVVGVLNQSPHIFDTTIFNNVRMGNTSASDEAVIQAIYQAGLGPVVDELSNGVHTFVEEGGKRFSGGERQRIALARILLQNVPVVIIDEPTIGLDPITERALLETVFDVLKGKTVFWITHHLASIQHADRVIFMEDGAIKMDGSPQVLKETNEHFNYLLTLDEA